MTLVEIRKWRDAAIADGWDHAPTYAPHEEEDRACRLKRDGFVVQTITREELAKLASIHAWGPDDLQVSVPDEYSMEALVKNLRRCNDCGAVDVETQRTGFAGRVCNTCLPAAKKRDEFPGWTK